MGRKKRINRGKKRVQRERRAGRGTLARGISAALLVSTFTALAGIYILNLWSIKMGAVGLTPFSFDSLSSRALALGYYLKYRLEERGSERESLGKFIGAAARRYNIPEKLLWAIVQVERKRKSGLIDEKGAVGPMGVTPSAVRALGSPLNPFRISHNVELGAQILYLLRDKLGSLDAAVHLYRDFMLGKGVSELTEVKFLSGHLSLAALGKKVGGGKYSRQVLSLWRK